LHLSVFQSTLVRFALIRFSICTGPILPRLRTYPFLPGLRTGPNLLVRSCRSDLSDFTKAENLSVFTRAENLSEFACPFCPILPRLRTRQFLSGLRTCPVFPRVRSCPFCPRLRTCAFFPKAEGVSDFQVWDIGQVTMSNFDWLPFTPLWSPSPVLHHSYQLSCHHHHRWPPRRHIGAPLLPFLAFLGAFSNALGGGLSWWRPATTGATFTLPKMKAAPTAPSQRRVEW
jgi:hypothetical protein